LCSHLAKKLKKRHRQSAEAPRKEAGNNKRSTPTLPHPLRTQPSMNFNSKPMHFSGASSCPAQFNLLPPKAPSQRPRVAPKRFPPSLLLPPTPPTSDAGQEKKKGEQASEPSNLARSLSDYVAFSCPDKMGFMPRSGANSYKTSFPILEEPEEKLKTCSASPTIFSMMRMSRTSRERRNRRNSSSAEKRSSSGSDLQPLDPLTESLQFDLTL
jgi:hypothetical protein